MAVKNISQFFRVCQWPIFSRKAVQYYVTNPKKKLNKNEKIGNFATHSTKEIFMICPLWDGEHD